MEQVAQIERLRELNDEFERVILQYTNLLFLMRLEKDVVLLARMKVVFEAVRQDMKRLTNEQAEVIEQMKGHNKMKTVGKWMIQAVLVIALVLLGGMVVVAQDAPLATNTPQIVDGAATLVSSEPILTQAPAPVETEQAPVIIVTTKPIVDENPPPISNGVNVYYVIGFVLFMVYITLKDFLKHRETNSLVSGINSLVLNQQTMTLAQQTYNQASVGVQQAIEMFRAFVGVVSAANIPGLDPIADAGKIALDKIVTGQDDSVDTSAGGDFRAEMLRRMDAHDAAERSGLPTIADPDPFKPQYPVDGTIG